MEMQKSEEVLEIKNTALMDFYPENLQNSKLLPFITENLSFKIHNFASAYHKQEVESFDLLKNCDFLTLKESIAEYDEEKINNIFICDEYLLNIDIIKEIRYIPGVEYSRFYKKNDKWIIVPLKQNKQIFMNYIKDNKIKMFNLKKSSIINNINYLSESNGLKDKRKNSDFSNNGTGRWRKFSKNFPSHKGSHNSNGYMNYYKGYKGRERFNSDGYNYTKNNNDYYSINSNYIKQNKKKEKIEVEIGEIKYPLTIDYKYSINNLIDIYQQLKKENYFEKKPVFLIENNEILNNKPKELQIIQMVSTSSNNSKKTQAFNNNNFGDKNDTRIKIPKYNPLSKMKKPFNKFDSIPDNNEIFVK